MYKDWFLDYASYVILERAVPAIEDGFKPVQRRIMHSLKELDDGRYNKVTNVVGTPCSIILTEIRVLVMQWCKLVKRIID
jgi:DNA gyrase/topoisomerase IV subunit A